MGSGVSAAINSKEQVDLEKFKVIAGEHFSMEVYNAYKDENGFISKEKLMLLEKSVEKIRQLRKEFTELVPQGSTTLGVEEVHQLMKKLGYSGDVDFAGEKTSFNFMDYLNVMLAKAADIHVDHEIIDTFKLFDVNGDGFITVTELKQTMTEMGDPLTDQEAQDMINVADRNGDGMIDFAEYSIKMTSDHHSDQ